MQRGPVVTLIGSTYLTTFPSVLVDPGVKPIYAFLNLLLHNRASTRHLHGTSYAICVAHKFQRSTETYVGDIEDLRVLLLWFDRAKSSIEDYCMQQTYASRTVSNAMILADLGTGSYSVEPRELGAARLPTQQQRCNSNSEINFAGSARTRRKPLTSTGSLITSQLDMSRVQDHA